MTIRLRRLIDGIAPLLEQYDGFLLDQFGVLHDGVCVFEGVKEALVALRRSGATVVILSNSGKLAASNRARLSRIGITPDHYSDVMSAGETAWRAFAAGPEGAFADLGRRCLFLSRNGDRSAIEGLDLALTDDPMSADLVLLSSVCSDPSGGRECIRLLERALAHGLPLVCTNPDLIGFDGERRYPGPGALARLYANAGGDVRYVGKPWPAIYRAALASMTCPTERIVAIGDSLEHDIDGAARFGIDSVLILAGVHAGAFAGASGETELLGRLETLLAGRGHPPRWLLRSFRL